MSRRGCGALLSAWLAVGSGGPAATEADPAAVLKKADAPHEAFAEGVITLRVIVSEKGKAPVESLLELFVKDLDKSVCVFREGKQKGRKILSVGDRVWLIVPGATKSIPVSKTQRLMGAASFGDIARMRFADEFDATLRPGEQNVPSHGGEIPCRVLDLSAKRAGASYPKGVLWTGRDDGRPRKLRLSLASGKEAKEVRFLDYGPDGRLKTMEISDLLAASGDNATSLTFERYEQRALDPAIFDPEGARAIP